MRLSRRRLLDVQEILWDASGSGPTIDIDIDNILGCDDATVGCEGGCSQAQDGTIIFGYQQGVSWILVIGIGGAHSST